MNLTLNEWIDTDGIHLGVPYTTTATSTYTYTNEPKINWSDSTTPINYNRDYWNGVIKATDNFSNWLNDTNVAKKYIQMVNEFSKDKEKDEMEEEKTIAYRELAMTNFRVLTKPPVIEKAYFPRNMTVTVFYCDRLVGVKFGFNGVEFAYKDSDEKSKTVKVTCVGGDEFSYETGLNIAIAKVLFGDTYEFPYIERIANDYKQIKFIKKLVKASIKEYKERKKLEARYKVMEQERKEIIKRRKAKKIAKKNKRKNAERQFLVDTISDIVNKTGSKKKGGFFGKKKEENTTE